MGTGLDSINDNSSRWTMPFPWALAWLHNSAALLRHAEGGLAFGTVPGDSMTCGSVRLMVQQRLMRRLRIRRLVRPA